jgi:hypothetical protein
MSKHGTVQKVVKKITLCVVGVTHEKIGAKQCFLYQVKGVSLSKKS